MNAGMVIAAHEDPPAGACPAWQMHALVFTTLFCLFLIPAPSSYGTPFIGIVALALGLYRTDIARFCENYRLALWATLFLIMTNVAVALMPGRALAGAYDVMRSILLMLPALWVAEHAPRALVLRGLKVFAVALSLGFGTLCLALADSHALMPHIYAWSELHFGNVHNLVNMSAVVLLALVVILLFERRPGQRLFFLVLLFFGVWFQWLLKSEGTYLALILCGFAWAALQFGGVLRCLAIVALLGGLIGYGLLMSFPEAFRAVTQLSLGGFEIRAQLNTRVLELVAERPLLGYGMSNFKDLPGTVVDGMRFFYPHQIYLEALFSFGVVGSALFVAALIGFFRYSSRTAIVSDPLAMLGFLTAVYLASKGLTDMKLIALQPLGMITLAAGFMARRPGIGRPVPAAPVR